MNSDQFVCQCYRPSTDSWLQVELPSELVREMEPAKIVDWIIKEFNGQWIPKDMTHGFEEIGPDSKVSQPIRQDQWQENLL